MKNKIDIEISIPAHTRYLRMIGSISEQMVRELDYPDEVRGILSDQLVTVLTEGLVNAVRHAQCSGSDNEIRIRVTVCDENLTVRIFDNGCGFDLETIPAPCFSSNGLEEKGRGIFILRSLMDTVLYTRSDGGNVLEMRKKLV